MEQKDKHPPTQTEINEDAKRWLAKACPAELGNLNVLADVDLLLSHPLHMSDETAYLKGEDGRHWIRSGDERMMGVVSKLKALGIQDEPIREVIRKSFSYLGVRVPIPPKVREYLESRS